MNSTEREDGYPGIDLPEASPSALRGKQSVRATFKLAEHCIQAIAIVAAHLGIKQKSLFDHLVEDSGTLRALARENPPGRRPESAVATKTFVVSRHSMEVLKKVSEESGVSQESLVELSVRRLLPIIEKERENHRERKKITRQVEAHLEACRKLHERIERRFGSDDFLFRQYDRVLQQYQACHAEIRKYIDRGRTIESFETGDF